MNKSRTSRFFKIRPVLAAKNLERIETELAREI